MPFIFEKQEIEDVVLIKPMIFEDNRGFFMESYKKSDFEKNGVIGNFVQDNHSKSTYKTLRGLHFQKEPHSQAKIVRCSQGEIIDVAVDLRKNSKTFKKYVKVNLSSENKNMLFIPKGFAHGFVCLSETCEVLYKTDCEYNKEADCGVFWKDSEINIDWEIDFEPILSSKDLRLKKLNELNSEELF